MTKTQKELKQHKILQKQITKTGKQTEKEAQHQSIITQKQIVARRHPAESLGIKQPPHARGVHATPHEDGGEYPNGCTETRNYGPISDNGERQSVLGRTLETYMRKSNLVRI